MLAAYVSALLTPSDRASHVACLHAEFVDMCVPPPGAWWQRSTSYRPCTAVSGGRTLKAWSTHCPSVRLSVRCRCVSFSAVRQAPMQKCHWTYDCALSLLHWGDEITEQHGGVRVSVCACASACVCVCVLCVPVCEDPPPTPVTILKQNWAFLFLVNLPKVCESG